MQGSPAKLHNQKKKEYEKPMITIEVYESYKKKYCSKQEQMHASYWLEIVSTETLAGRRQRQRRNATRRKTTSTRKKKEQQTKQ
jgi:hypothetical protein